MKKVLIGMLALVLCMGLASCAKELSLAEVVEKAKTEGANWNEDQWKDCMKSAMLAMKPYLLEMKELGDKAKAAQGDAAAVQEIMNSMTELNNKYPDFMSLMQEFGQIVEKNEVAKKLSDDPEFEKSLREELGIPEI